MGRVFFPTTSLNRFGVRDTDQQATLGAVTRFPAEPTPRAAMTPTGPLLGGLDGELGIMAERMYSNGGYPGTAYWGARPPIRVVQYNPPATPYLSPQPTPPQVVSSSGGGGGVAASAPAGAPVSAQQTPTPVATLPPPSPSVVLVSSGGGTQTPATAPAAAAAPTTAGGLVEGIAAWLSGSTSLLNYKVPNAVLAGVVVLGFAWLSSGSTGRKR